MSYYPISVAQIKHQVLSRLSKAKPSANNHRASLLNTLDYPNVSLKTNQWGEEVTVVDGEIPPSLPVKDEQRFLFKSYDQSALTHGLHKYPAKFFPELPRWLIHRYSSQGDMVLDPFCGSGTTNIEALLARRNSVGVDVDPFSRWLCKVKTTPLDSKALASATDSLLERLEKFKPSDISDDDIPLFPYRDKWFNREIILELAFIKNRIHNLIESELRDFYLACLSSIIRRVSNADDNCTRTVIRKKLNKQVLPGDALKAFAEAILLNTPRMLEFSRLCPTNIKVEFPEDSDARDIKYPGGFFDLAVTSPPYVNAVDYPRTHQLEIYWLGFASGSLTPLKRKHVGTESVHKKQYEKLYLTKIDEADRVISRIYDKDPRRAYIAYKFLSDMRANLQEVYRVLKSGSAYVMVIGNNRIRGELFESWRYLMPMATQIGFKIENYFASEIINHFIKVPRKERINTDWILVLKKP